MAEPTREQLTNLRKLAAKTKCYSGWGTDLNALLAAYEERGQEAKAAQRRFEASAETAALQGCDLSEVREKLEQAEAKLAEARATKDMHKERQEQEIALRLRAEAQLAEALADLRVAEAALVEVKRKQCDAEAREAKLREAATGLVGIIDKAGLLNLSNGVQLGATSWYVKASDRLKALHAALAASPAPPDSEAALIEAGDLMFSSVALHVAGENKIEAAVSIPDWRRAIREWAKLRGVGQIKASPAPPEVKP